MNWLFARLSEPSTWAGIAAVAVTVGQAFPPAMVATVPLAAICGALAGVMKEKGNA